MSLRLLLLFLIIFTGNFLPAQDKPRQIQQFTISGYVKEEATGELLIGASVYVREGLKGVATNPYGFYSLTLQKDTYHLVVSFMGFEDTAQVIVLDKDLRINFSLQPKRLMAKEVVVTGEKSDQNIKSTEMGTVSLEVQQIKSLPAFMGEVDILKTIQLLPGVKSAGDGNSGFYVRGGGPDQNLILLDEAVVYNASHLLGFFSVFNGDAIKSVSLIKGGMPAQYGGRLSSVLDITMKEGNNKKFNVEGGLGLISSRITVQGPIKKDTSSFILSARRTYVDVVMKPFIKKSSPFKGSGYYFFDVNGKVNYRLSDKDRLFMSGYYGKDVFSLNNKESGLSVSIPWGNATGSMRWNHLFNDKLFSNTSLVFSDYLFEFGASQSGFDFRLYSGIRDWNLKSDFSYFPNNKHQVRFGVNYTYHIFSPSNATAKSGDVEFDLGKIKKQYAHEVAAYIGDDFQVTDLFAVNVGLRLSYFMQIGPFDRFIKDIQGKIVDTIEYKAFEKVEDYFGPEPRVTARYILDERSSLKASFTHNYQYVHLATVSGTTMPTDVWVPCSDRVKPQISQQYAMGYFRNFKEDMFETSVEVYYKKMNNLIEYGEEFQPDDNARDNTDNNFVFGTGDSYGAEFFFKKRLGKLTGWMGYTLSRTNRVFPGLNEGKEFPAKYDRTHDGSLVLSYDFRERWNFSAVFVYGTGSAITLPVERYFFEGRIVTEFGERNSFRMAPYHRGDIAATLKGKKGKKFESSWTFALFNVYNRKNPFFIYFDNEGSIEKGNLKVSAKQVSLFPVLPSVTWNFKF